MQHPVKTSVEGSLGVVTIDRPNALNSLSSGVMTEIRNGLQELEGTVDVVIVETTSDVFSAGADLKEIAGSDVREFEEFQRTSVETYRYVQTFPVITIAAVDGLAYGGGFALALAADMIVAEGGAEFALPEVQLGLVPAGGGVIRRLAENVGLNRAKELLTTGEPISAEEAGRLGLVNRVVSSGEATDSARELAEEVSQNPSTAVQANKVLANESLEMSVDALATSEMESSVRLFCHEEVRKTITAFVDRE